MIVSLTSVPGVNQNRFLLQKRAGDVRLGRKSALGLDAVLLSLSWCEVRYPLKADAACDA